MPPQLLGMVPNNIGGFGSPEVAARVFAVNELKPLQEVFSGLNAWIGEEVVRFGEYAITLPEKSKPT